MLLFLLAFWSIFSWADSFNKCEVQAQKWAKELVRAELPKSERKRLQLKIDNMKPVKASDGNAGRVNLGQEGYEIQLHLYDENRRCLFIILDQKTCYKISHRFVPCD